MTNQPNLSSLTIRALERTRSLINRFGPRMAGTGACQQVAEELRRELQSICGHASRESFQTHPLAFMGFYKISVLLYIASLICLFFNRPLLAAIGFTFLLVGEMLEFGFYIEFYDWLFPRRTCWNTWASLEPRGEPHQQIILSGHHDSAQELSFLRRWQKLLIVRAFAPDLFYLASIVFSWLWVFSAATPGYAASLRIFLAFGLVFIVPKFFIVSSRATPGAGDNLIASSMLVELAGEFADPQNAGKSTLNHTRLIFASFDAEESALRGSRAFVKAHCPMLKKLPTYALNIDSIYTLKDLQFLVSDLNGYVQLSKEMAQECLEIAFQCGYPARLCKMVFGGGSTDAAELAKVGVQATTMIAMPTNIIRDGLAYHTMQDTVEAIEPEAVEACLSVAQVFVRRKDGMINHSEG